MRLPLAFALVVAFFLAAGVSAQEAAIPPEAASAEALAEGEATEEETDEEARTLGDWYAMGGWVMHLLVATSIISVIVILERTWSLRRGAVIPRRFLKRYRDHAHRGDLKQVVELSATSEHSIARILRAGLVHFDDGLASMGDAAVAAGDNESAVLRRNLPLLSALGNMATMLGLLGTVLGMIESFDLIAKTGTGDARVVAGGIFQALVTTAAGLMVGLTAIGAHSFLRRRADALAIEPNEKSARMLEDLWIARGAEAREV